MKNLILINGTMGVGKTTTGRALQQLLPDCVFLDGDWCWDMRPFVVNAETKKMVEQNIYYLLNNFLHCSVYQNIIFCWVMHEQVILDHLLAALDLSDCCVYQFSLVCSEQALIKRLELDVAAGLRVPEGTARSLPRLQNYQSMATLKIDTSEISAAQAAEKILSYIHAAAI